MNLRKRSDCSMSAGFGGVGPAGIDQRLSMPVGLANPATE